MISVYMAECTFFLSLSFYLFIYFFFFGGGGVKCTSLTTCFSLKVTFTIKHGNTAEEIIVYAHRVYSILLKLEKNKV